MRLTVIIASLALGLVLGAAAAMLLLPAPNFQLFVLGLAAQEWAVWFLVLAAAGCLGSLFGFRGAAGIWRTLALAGGILNVAALALILWMFNLEVNGDLTVRSNMPAVVEGGAGSFSLGTFLSGGGDGVLAHGNVAYATVGGQHLLLDIYTSLVEVSADRAAPALVVVHGGSWRSGDKGEVAAFSKTLAGRGYVVFDVAYRLAPAAPFPAGVADIKCAIGWIKANAATYGVDPARLVLLGRSAGAQLALVSAYSAGSAELPPSCPAGDTSVLGVIAYYAPTRLDYYNKIKPELTVGALDDYLGGPPEGRENAYQLARPATWIGANTPPTLLFHGGRDQFVRLRDAQELADSLAAANRPYALVELPWANHGFDFNFTGVSNQRVQPYVDRFLSTINAQ